MTKMNGKMKVAGAVIVAALLAGCAGYPLGSGPLTPALSHQPSPEGYGSASEGRGGRAAPAMGGYYTDAHYAAILRDQGVIEDRRGNEPLIIAPQCEQAARRAAVKAEWAAARTAPDQPSQEGYGLASAAAPSSDVDDE